MDVKKLQWSIKEKKNVVLPCGPQWRHKTSCKGYVHVQRHIEFTWEKNLFFSGLIMSRCSGKWLIQWCNDVALNQFLEGHTMSQYQWSQTHQLKPHLLNLTVSQTCVCVPDTVYFANQWSSSSWLHQSRPSQWPWCHLPASTSFTESAVQPYSI